MPAQPAPQQPPPEPSFNNADIGQNLVAIQNHLHSLNLQASARQQLYLLQQRQRIEHEELKLRHFLELEKFLKQQKEDMKTTQVAQQPAPPSQAAAAVGTPPQQMISAQQPTVAQPVPPTPSIPIGIGPLKSTSFLT
ncbi:hypothetical protein ZHAS_00017998 [Anopheles sinensis]|uniref:Uncharacterized protein n=1 Tax=Anopheles sinensis TaxID=74873 RepID=A0A084WIB7_ANOSI|nr:hypothetical protein ZHAS_00017998 [Anopheles sinensis]